MTSEWSSFMLERETRERSRRQLRVLSWTLLTDQYQYSLSPSHCPWLFNKHSSNSTSVATVVNLTCKLANVNLQNKITQQNIWSWGLLLSLVRCGVPGSPDLRSRHYLPTAGGTRKWFEESKIFWSSVKVPWSELLFPITKCITKWSFMYACSINCRPFLHLTGSWCCAGCQT